MTAENLLDLQRLDLESGQLTHRRLNLDERQQLVAARTEQELQQTDIDMVAASRVEVALRQRRFMAEAQIAADRAATDEGRLYGGEIQGVKNLEALQYEIAGLRSRQDQLEDEALEAMEEAETLAAQGASLEQARAAVDQRIVDLELAIAAAEVEIDGEIDRLSAERRQAVGCLDGPLVAEYERLRPGFGAATVIRFDGARCVGCPSVMPAMEVDRIKRLEGTDPTNCEECGRIVLR